MRFEIVARTPCKITVERTKGVVHITTESLPVIPSPTARTSGTGGIVVLGASYGGGGAAGPARTTMGSSGGAATANEMRCVGCHSLKNEQHKAGCSELSKASGSPWYVGMAGGGAGS